MSPFICDLCIFRILRKTNPIKSSECDKLLLACIRRANLDVLWSRATRTVKENARRSREIEKFCKTLQIPTPFDNPGPFPFEDFGGFTVAISILMKSRQPGRHDANYTQYSTVRHLRAAYSNFLRASSSQATNGLALGGTDGRYTRLTNDKCSSLWFQKFMEGLRNRMGQVHKPNKAMTHELFLQFLERTQLRIESAEDEEMKDRWLTFYVYAMLSTLLSLRGNEGFLLSLDGLHTYWEKGWGKYVTIPLFGKMKGESGDMNHLLPCCEITSSGLKVRDTLKLFLDLKKGLGFTFGPAIIDNKGKLIPVFVMDQMIIEVLEELYEENHNMFPADMLAKEQLAESYQCFRTFRRTSDSHATNKRLKKSDITTVNRWKSVERASGKMPNQEMQQHYAQFDTLIEPFLRYTSIF